MRGCIKCFFKIQYECVNLSSIVQDFSQIIYYRNQLSTKPFRPHDISALDISALYVLA